MVYGALETKLGVILKNDDQGVSLFSVFLRQNLELGWFFFHCMTFKPKVSKKCKRSGDIDKGWRKLQLSKPWLKDWVTLPVIRQRWKEGREYEQLLNVWWHCRFMEKFPSHMAWSLKRGLGPKKQQTPNPILISLVALGSCSMTNLQRISSILFRAEVFWCLLWCWDTSWWLTPHLTALFLVCLVQYHQRWPAVAPRSLRRGSCSCLCLSLERSTWKCRLVFYPSVVMDPEVSWPAAGLVELTTSYDCSSSIPLVGLLIFILIWIYCGFVPHAAAPVAS